MGENTNQIEREIQTRRVTLDRNLDELEGRAREIADWRTHYRSRPGLFLGIAFGAGLAFGLSTISQRSPRSPSETGPYDYAMGHSPLEPAHSVLSSNTARAKRQIGETWDQIADGLLKLASAKAIQTVADFVPGFRDELRQPARDAHRT